MSAIGTDDGASCSDNQPTCTRRCGLASLCFSQGPGAEQLWLVTDESSARPPPKAARERSGWHKQIGKIAPGYKADIVFSTCTTSTGIPTNDPVNQVVHTEDGSGVRIR